LEIVTAPPQAHVQVLSAVSSGKPRFRAIGAPGAQGDVSAGMQGCGVGTPPAAAVAARTIGLAGDMHSPKVLMFDVGTKSATVAKGAPLTLPGAAGATTSAHVAAPILHVSVAPPVTRVLMLSLLSFNDGNDECLVG
jgi:hypothetical protein